MKYFFSLVILLMALPIQADQITAYVCDTCNSQGSQVLAKSYTPPAQCNFTNPPGTVPTPGDMDCSAPARKLIVVNPLTEKAFKYRVQRECQSTWCNPNVTLTHLTLTNDEQEALITFYDIDSTMRNAIGEMNQMTAMSINGSFESLNTTSSSEQCSDNPMDYFTDINTQRNIERKITEKIREKVGHRPWSDYITTSYYGPSSFQISTQGGNVTFDQENIAHPAFERYFFGGTSEARQANNLNFRVNYLGRVSDQPGVSSFGLQLVIDRSTSWVDGYRLSNLTLNGGTVDVTDSLDSMPCFKEFLDEQESEIVGPPVSGGGGGDGDPSLPGDGSSGWQLCPATVNTRVCSTTSDGTQCTVTTYTSLVPC